MGFKHLHHFSKSVIESKGQVDIEIQTFEFQFRIHHWQIQEWTVPGHQEACHHQGKPLHKSSTTYYEFFSIPKLALCW